MSDEEWAMCISEDIRRKDSKENERKPVKIDPYRHVGYNRS